jgi:hypothetical protein
MLIYPLNMVIFPGDVRLPEGKPPFSYGFPMVFLWFSWLKSAKYESPQVLITGASAGIGRDLALLLARNGANVALLARRGAASTGGFVAQVDRWRSPEVGGTPRAEWFLGKL